MDQLGMINRALRRKHIGTKRHWGEQRGKGTEKEMINAAAGSFSRADRAGVVRQANYEANLEAIYKAN